MGNCCSIYLLFINVCLFALTTAFTFLGKKKKLKVAVFKKSQSIDFPMKKMHVVCSAICLFDHLQCFCFFLCLSLPNSVRVAFCLYHEFWIFFNAILTFLDFLPLNKISIQIPMGQTHLCFGKKPKRDGRDGNKNVG